MSKRKLSDAQIAEIKRHLLARSVFWQSQRSLACYQLPRVFGTNPR